MPFSQDIPDLRYSVKCCSWSPQFIMVESAVLCDVILVVLKLLFTFSFLHKMQLMSYWLDHTSSFHTTCNARHIDFSRLCKHLISKLKQKQVIWVVLEAYSKLLQKLIISNWVSFNSLYLSNGKSSKNESWMNRTKLPTSVICNLWLQIKVRPFSW